MSISSCPSGRAGLTGRSWGSVETRFTGLTPLSLLSSLAQLTVFTILSTLTYRERTMYMIMTIKHIL
jgi:hypothetical protein